VTPIGVEQAHVSRDRQSDTAFVRAFMPTVKVAKKPDA
jgi:hypothetical protein